MAVFYNREKSKVGTTTGTIINWSKQLTSNDPDDANTRDALPAGYLRCDGSIYSADIFPELAAVLGVGAQSRYKKPNVTLLENQFQLPDFGSKKLRASSGSNLGLEVDLRIQDDNDQEITKSGVGLEVQSNIGTTYEILYQGSFFLPSQVIPVTGEPGFTRSTGNYTEEIDVLPNAFLPHAHFHDGTRTRVRSSLNNEFSAFGRNFYRRKSTLCVVPWYYNTRQPLCLLVATRSRLSGISNPDGQGGGLGGLFGTCTRNVYGGCLSGCTFDQAPAYNCLIPEGTSCGYPTWSGVSNCAQGNQPADVESCGEIEYTGTIFTECTGSGLACGDFPAQPKTGSITIPVNYNDDNLPFDAAKDNDAPGYSAISNVTNEVASFGNDGTHRHFVNFNANPHTYQVNTQPAFIPASNLESTISVQVNSENKADQFIQPYIVQEFLIKF